MSDVEKLRRPYAAGPRRLDASARGAPRGRLVEMDDGRSGARLVRTIVGGLAAFGLAALLGAGIGGLIARARSNERSPVLENPWSARGSELTPRARRSVAPGQAASKSQSSNTAHQDVLA